MIRVLLADDEAMVRAGISAILRTDPDIEVAAEVADGRQAVEAARRLRPDVALLDIRMPVLDGLSATAEIRRALPGTPVVILTTFGEDAYIDRALAEGANGFLLKTGDPRDLLAALHAVAGGAAYLAPEVAHRLIEQLGRPRLSAATTAHDRIAALTTREREVLALIGTGRTNAEIAARLHVAEGTVKAYVTTILSTIQARNRVEAALTAYRAGLVPDRPA